MKSPDQVVAEIRAQQARQKASRGAVQSPASLYERAKVLHELQLRDARKYAARFAEYAIRHERTGKRIKNAPHHEAWHRHLDLNRFAIIFAPVEHGKTQQIGITRVIHKLGQEPERRIAIVSNTGAQASKLLGSIKAHIENNPRVREVFPHLRRSTRPGDPWHSTQLTVQRNTIAKDPSIQALGVTGPLVGSRVDVLVLDDVLDFENTRTKEQRAKLLEWFETTAATRVTATGEIWIIGTPWMSDDLMHELSKRAGYATVRYSAVQNPSDAPSAWIPLWPEQFTTERLVEVYNNTTPGNFARKYLCQVRMDQHARFQQEWLDRAVAQGKGWKMFDRAPMSAGKAWPCFTGVDLGVGEGAEHDLSCLFTIALEPGTRRRVVVDVQSGRWQAPEIVRRILDTYQRFGSIVVVESNGAQRFLAQFAQAGGLPVRTFYTTAQNKYDEAFGVESLAVEMRNGLWLIPSGQSGAELTEDVREWQRDMLFYSPESHTGDRLMASWFAREAARNYAPEKTFGYADTQAR